MIKFLDLSAINNEFKNDFLENVQNIYSTEYWINGNSVTKFENQFANYIGSKFAVGTSNGLDALRLSLILKGIKEGDEVLVPSFTFIATWLAVTSLGAIPVPIDVSNEDLNINPSLIEKSINSKTKAIIPVHMFGRPCDIENINNISSKNNLCVIEDCAQAHGAIYKNKKIGDSSNLCAWSFYPGKNLGALGDAGAITCSRNEEFKILKAISNYGSNEKYIHFIKGLNTRLDSLQALFLSKKLIKLDEHNSARKKQASIYFSLLSDIDDIKLLPEDTNETKSAWHLFPIRIEERDKLKEFLRKNNIETLIHYPIALKDQKAFQDFDFSKYSTTIGDNAGKELLSLPIGPHLCLDDIYNICSIVRKFFH